MAEDNNNMSSRLESALAEINALEKEIALTDYELRNALVLTNLCTSCGPANISQGTGQKVPEVVCQERRSGGQNSEFLATCGIPLTRTVELTVSLNSFLSRHSTIPTLKISRCLDISYISLIVSSWPILRPLKLHEIPMSPRMLNSLSLLNPTNILKMTHWPSRKRSATSNPLNRTTRSPPSRLHWNGNKEKIWQNPLKEHLQVFSPGLPSRNWAKKRTLSQTAIILPCRWPMKYIHMRTQSFKTRL